MKGLFMGFVISCITLTNCSPGIYTTKLVENVALENQCTLKVDRSMWPVTQIGEEKIEGNPKVIKIPAGTHDVHYAQPIQLGGYIISKDTSKAHDFEPGKSYKIWRLNIGAGISNVLITED